MTDSLSRATRRQAAAQAIIWVAWILALTHVVANRICWRDIAMQTDVGIWSYIAWRMNQGARLYADLWDQKPPGVYLLFQVIQQYFADQSQIALLWLDAAITLAVLITTFRVSRLVAGPLASAWATVPLAIILGHRVLADWGCNTEKFVALFEMLGAYSLIRGFRARSPAIWLLFSGAACGTAAMFKQTGVLLLFSACVLLLFIGPRPGRRRSMIWLLAGGAIAWLPLIAMLMSQGILRDFWRNAVVYDLLRVASSDTEVSRLTTLTHWTLVWAAIRSMLLLLGPALIALVVLLRTMTQESSDSEPAAIGLKIMMLHSSLVVLVFVVAPHGYGHFLLQAAPAWAVLTAWLLQQIFARSISSVWRWPLIAVVIAGFFTLGDHFRFMLDSRYAYRQAYALQTARYAALVAALREFSEADDTVMLWPPDAAASYLARRWTPLENSNAAIVLNGRINLLRPNPLQLVEQLRRNPPVVIIDLTLRETLGAPGDSRRALRIVPGLSLWEAADEQHPTVEGRELAPLKRWVRANYGGQMLIPGVGTILLPGRTWREWPEVLNGN